MQSYTETHVIITYWALIYSSTYVVTWLRYGLLMYVGLFGYGLLIGGLILEFLILFEPFVYTYPLLETKS